MSTYEWAEFGLSLLKTLLSWPVVVGVLGTVLLVRFKDPISDLIRRLSNLAFPGGGAKFTPPSQGTTPPTLTLEEAQRRAAAADQDPAIQAAQQAIKWWWFEKVWNLIYKSQIEILEALAVAPGGIGWVDLHSRFYVPLVAKFPGGFGAYQFPQYMGFLANTAKFVMWDVTVDQNNPPVTITPLGREFLGYIRTQGYSKDIRIY